jgi:spore coat protein U-like protein
MHRLTLRLSLVAAALALAFVAAPAAAQGTSTALITVSATVVKNCKIDTAPISLGNYDPLVANFSNAATPTSTVTVRCSKNTGYSVGIDNGGNYSSGARRMKHATYNEYLSYELFSDAALTMPWTDAAPVTGTSTSRAPIGLTVYARIPGGQDVSEGGYADVVTATVNF